MFFAFVFSSCDIFSQKKFLFVKQTVQLKPICQNAFSKMFYFVLLRIYLLDISQIFVFFAYFSVCSPNKFLYSMQSCVFNLSVRRSLTLSRLASVKSLCTENYTQYKIFLCFYFFYNLRFGLECRIFTLNIWIIKFWGLRKSFNNKNYFCYFCYFLCVLSSSYLLCIILTLIPPLLSNFL